MIGLDAPKNDGKNIENARHSFKAIKEINFLVSNKNKNKVVCSCYYATIKTFCFWSNSLKMIKNF